MTDGAIRELLTNASDNLDFFRFFELVQSVASGMGKVIFLWSPECRDGQVEDAWREDLSGWLVLMSDSDAFERMWKARDPRIQEKDFEEAQVFARWSEGRNGEVLIAFEHPLAPNAQ